MSASRLSILPRTQPDRAVQNESEKSSGDESEEGGVYIAPGATWYATRRGAHLVLKYDAQADAFKGSVVNSTNANMCAVRVEVQLSAGGGELGPTRAERPNTCPQRSIGVSREVNAD